MSPSGERARSDGVPLGTSSRASVRVQRKLEWVDTDASGHWHHTAALRMVESAETTLLERLGVIGEIYGGGGCPRVHIVADYWQPIHFEEVADIVVEVAGVGQASVTFDAEVSVQERRCARVRLIAVLRDADGAPTPWPDHLRAVLLGSGPQEPQLLP